MSPSKSSLDRLPKHLSSRWEEHREAFEESLRADTLTVPATATALAVSLDGVMAPMKDGDRHVKRAAAQAAGRATKGPAGFREVGCGTVCSYDCDGERLGTLRIGRMPQANKVTLKQMLSAEVEAALAQRPDLEVVKLADGAHDNWRYLDELLPQAQSSQTLGGLLSCRRAAPRCRGWRLWRERRTGASPVREASACVAPRSWRRGKGDPRATVSARQAPAAQTDQASAGLLSAQPQADGLRGGGRARGLPIGSGVVEAACKTLVTERMKRSGMRWREAGGQAILTLRGWAQSDRFAAAWSLLSATYRAEVSLSDEVESAYGRAA